MKLVHVAAREASEPGKRFQAGRMGAFRKWDRDARGRGGLEGEGLDFDVALLPI